MNFDIELAEFVQIIHNGRGYWLTISTIGTSHPNVHVHVSISRHTRESTDSCISTYRVSSNRLKFMRFQMQVGGYDFGLFAAPGQFHFEQQKMQHHLSM